MRETVLRNPVGTNRVGRPLADAGWAVKPVDRFGETIVSETSSTCTVEMTVVATANSLSASLAPSLTVSVSHRTSLGNDDHVRCASYETFALVWNGALTIGE
jgi:hypothetical protein